MHVFISTSKGLSIEGPFDGLSGEKADELAFSLPELDMASRDMLHKPQQAMDIQLEGEHNDLPWDVLLGPALGTRRTGN